MKIKELISKCQFSYKNNSSKYSFCPTNFGEFGHKFADFIVGVLKSDYNPFPKPLKGVSEMIKQQNVNLRRFCKQNSLKLYCLLNMLKGKQMFKYKYKMKLNERLFEKDCYLPYLDRFEKEGGED